VQRLPVGSADGRSGFTALFERLAISLLREDVDLGDRLSGQLKPYHL